MKNANSARKTVRDNEGRDGQRGSAGPAGVAVVPPAYGIDAVDHGAVADRPDQANAPASLESATWSSGAPLQRKPVKSGVSSKACGNRGGNKTGLPDKLKVGIEHLSGLSMADVKVHYNSARPARLQALAYTQGTDIHVGPGQERHLPHEAWHAVQQKQGRVKPTTQANGVSINANQTLEREANVMGAKTLQIGRVGESAANLAPQTPLDLQQRALGPGTSSGHRHAPVQRRIYTLGWNDDEPTPRSIEQLLKKIPELANEPFALANLQALHDSSQDHILAENESGKIPLSEVQGEIAKLVVGRFADVIGSDFRKIRGSIGTSESKWPPELKALDTPAQEGFIEFLRTVSQEKYGASVSKSRRLEPQTTGVSMKHIAEFGQISDSDAENVGYIRFVRATKLRGTEISATVPGYVNFGGKERAKPGWQFIDQRRREAEMKKIHKTKPKWAFDGPASGLRKKELVEGYYQNLDTPGEIQTRPEHFPYILITDFIGVLFNKMTMELLNVVEYSDMLSLEQDPFSQQREVDKDAHKKLMALYT